MKSLKKDLEFKRYKLAVGRWESEGGAPAPYFPEAPERQETRSHRDWSPRTRRQEPGRISDDDWSAREQADHLSRGRAKAAPPDRQQLLDNPRASAA